VGERSLTNPCESRQLATYSAQPRHTSLPHKVWTRRMTSSDRTTRKIGLGWLPLDPV
jgi:hypothetical protein